MNYGFKDEDCTLIRKGRLSFNAKCGVSDLMRNRKYFVERTKSYSGVQKSMIINELLLMFEEHDKMTDDVIKYLYEENEKLGGNYERFKRNN